MVAVVDKNPLGYIDVNPDPLRNGRGDLVYGTDAVMVGSIRNLFMCPVGDRGRIFQPRYGTSLYHLLQEPLDPVTAHRIHIALIQTIQSWEPRIEVLGGPTQVIPDYQLPGYHLILVFKVIGDDTVRSKTFELVTNG